jgi:hypothetical protein
MSSFLRITNHRALAAMAQLATGKCSKTNKEEGNIAVLNVAFCLQGSDLGEHYMRSRLILQKHFIQSLISGIHNKLYE